MSKLCRNRQDTHRIIMQTSIKHALIIVIQTFNTKTLAKDTSLINGMQDLLWNIIFSASILHTSDEVFFITPTYRGHEMDFQIQYFKDYGT